MSIRVVINAASGTARRYGAEALQNLITDVAQHHGLAELSVAVVPPGDLPAALRQAAAESDEIWVGGGDGTLRSAAELLFANKRQQILGVLPLGTMNLLARDLNIPLQIEQAVAALSQGEPTQIDLGRINQRLFLNKAALGLYPEMVVDRERRRRLWNLGQWGALGKWTAMARAAWRAMKRHRMLQITIDYHGQRRQIRSPAIVVAAGAYEFRPGQLFGRPDLQSGELALYISHERSALGSAGQLAKLFLGNLDSDPALEVIKAEHLRIDFPRPKPVACDGEIDMLPGPIDFHVEPRGLTVRQPKPTQP